MTAHVNSEMNALYIDDICGPNDLEKVVFSWITSIGYCFIIDEQYI